MMNKIELFKTRIFYENKTYLLVSDAAKALGYESIGAFMDEYSELIVSMEQMPKLISETDFNWLLSNDAVSLEKLKHLEITQIDTLRMKTETHKNLYPLKVMFASEMFKSKALSAGLSTIEEYIEKVDCPSEICRMIKEMKKEKDFIKTYKEQILQLRDPQFIDIQRLNKFGLEIQSYTRIKEGRVYLESFIVGQGIFYMIYMGGDEDYTNLTVVNGELFLSKYDFAEDKFVQCKIGKDSSKRDYRKFGVMENIIYVLMNKRIDDAGVDLLECSEAGVKMYILQSEVIKLFNPNMYRELLLVDGIVDFSCDSYLTKYNL